MDNSTTSILSIAQRLFPGRFARSINRTTPEKQEERERLTQASYYLIRKHPNKTFRGKAALSRFVHMLLANSDSRRFLFGPEDDSDDDDDDDNDDAANANKYARIIREYLPHVYIEIDMPDVHGPWHNEVAREMVINRVTEMPLDFFSRYSDTWIRMARIMLNMDNREQPFGLHQRRVRAIVLASDKGTRWIKNAVNEVAREMRALVRDIPVLLAAGARPDVKTFHYSIFSAILKHRIARKHFLEKIFVKPRRDFTYHTVFKDEAEPADALLEHLGGDAAVDHNFDVRIVNANHLVIKIDNEVRAVFYEEEDPPPYDDAMLIYWSPTNLDDSTIAKMNETMVDLIDDDIWAGSIQTTMDGWCELIDAIGIIAKADALIVHPIINCHKRRCDAFKVVDDQYTCDVCGSIAKVEKHLHYIML